MELGLAHLMVRTDLGPVRSLEDSLASLAPNLPSVDALGLRRGRSSDKIVLWDLIVDLSTSAPHFGSVMVLEPLESISSLVSRVSLVLLPLADSVALSVVTSRIMINKV